MVKRKASSLIQCDEVVSEDLLSRSEGSSYEVDRVEDDFLNSSSEPELERSHEASLESALGVESDETLSSEDEPELPELNSVDNLARRGNHSKESKFQTAMTAILNSKLKAYDREDPILVRNLKVATQIKEHRLETKAIRLLDQRKKRRLDRAHKAILIPDNLDEAGDALQHEKILKNIAQKGVVRLFNAIGTAQKVAQLSGSATAQVLKSKDVLSASKDTFLKMIRSG